MRLKNEDLRTFLSYKKTNNLIAQFLRYGIVGGIAFIADISLLCFLTEYCGINYLFSSTISFIVGLTVNYILSVKWVFITNDEAKTCISFLLFAAIGVIGLGINALILWFCTDIVLLYYIFSKIISTVIVFIWNFFARRYLFENIERKIKKGNHKLL